MQPPDGPPICTALNFLPSLMPPQTSKTISRIVMPIGTSTRPPRLTLPAMAKTFVPLLFSVPRAAKAAAPLRTIQGTLAKVSTLLMLVGQSHRPLIGRERRPHARHAALALDRGDERGLLAADEGAGALLELDVEVEAACRGCRRRGSRAPRPGRWRC